MIPPSVTTKPFSHARGGGHEAGTAATMFVSDLTSIMTKRTQKAPYTRVACCWETGFGNHKPNVRALWQRTQKQETVKTKF